MLAMVISGEQIRVYGIGYDHKGLGGSLREVSRDTNRLSERIRKENRAIGKYILLGSMDTTYQEPWETGVVLTVHDPAPNDLRELKVIRGEVSSHPADEASTHLPVKLRVRSEDGGKDYRLTNLSGPHGGTPGFLGPHQVEQVDHIEGPGVGCT